MKWQNLTNRICGSIFTLSLIANLIPVTAASAQEKKEDSPLLLKKCWVSISDEAATNLLASDNDFRVFLTRAGGKVDALDAKSGKPIWQSDFGGNVVSGLIGDQNNIFFATNPVSVGPSKPTSTSLRAISRQTGIIVWTASLPFSEIIHLGESGGNLFAIGADGLISAVRKTDGNIAWQSRLNKNLATAPWFGAGSIVFLLESGEIEIISPADGRTSFQMKTESALASIYLAEDNTLFWGDKKGNIAAVDVATKEIRWKLKNGAQISGITPAGKNILVTSYDNFVYLMSPTDGKILWKRRLSGRMAAKPLVTPTVAVIMIVGEPGASFLDIESGKLANRLVFDTDDYIVGSPIVAGGQIVFSKGDGIYSYSPGDCGLKEEKRGD